MLIPPPEHYFDPILSATQMVQKYFPHSAQPIPPIPLDFPPDKKFLLAIKYTLENVGLGTTPLPKVILHDLPPNTGSLKLLINRFYTQFNRDGVPPLPFFPLFVQFLRDPIIAPYIGPHCSYDYLSPTAIRAAISRIPKQTIDSWLVLSAKSDAANPLPPRAARNPLPTLAVPSSATPAITTIPTALLSRRAAPFLVALADNDLAWVDATVTRSASRAVFLGDAVGVALRHNPPPTPPRTRSQELRRASQVLLTIEDLALFLSYADKQCPVPNDTTALRHLIRHARALHTLGKVHLPHARLTLTP